MVTTLQRPSRDRPARPGALSTPHRVPVLDGWRGLAIALVLMGHFMPVPGVSLESAGVELFFVLSGRLIAEILFVDDVALGRFVWRRIARVYPSLVVFTLLVGPLHLVLGYTPPDIVPPLTFTANYVYAAAGEPLFFGHLWSLCVEEHSYLALVVVAVLHRLGGGGARTMILVLALICLGDLAVSELAFGQRDFAVLWRTDARAGSLLVSAGLHLATRHRIGAWRMRAWFGAVPVVAGLAGLALFGAWCDQLTQYALGGVAFAIAVNTIEAAPCGVARQLTNPGFRSLGRWSYSLYLWQQPFFVLSCLSPPLWRMPLLAAAVATGLVSFAMLERPSRRRLNDVGTSFDRWRARRAIQARS